MPRRIVVWIGVFLLQLALFPPVIGPLFDPNAAKVMAAPDSPQAIDAEEQVVKDAMNIFTLGGGFLYWAQSCPGGDPEFRGDGYLRRQPAYGLLVTTIVTTTAEDCWNFNEMSADDSGLYYFNNDLGQVERRPAGAPQSVHILHAGADTPVTGSELFISGNFVYWITTTGKLERVRKNGSQFADVLVGLPNPTDVFIEGGTAYWFDDTGLWRAKFGDCSSLPCPDTAKQRIQPGTGRYLFSYNSSPLPPADSFTLYVVSATAQEQILRIACATVLHPFPDPPSLECDKTPLYTAPSVDWEIGKLVTDGSYIFFPEYTVPPETTDLRIRRLPINGGSAETIVASIPNLDVAIRNNIYIDNNYVYYLLFAVGDRHGIYRIALDADPVVYDLHATELEVTQGIQDLDNAVPLVADKTTIVRGYATKGHEPPANAVDARLYGERNGLPLPGSPLPPYNGLLYIAAGSPVRDLNYTSFNFLLPPSWTGSGNTTLRFVVDPTFAYNDLNHADNEMAPQTFTFNRKSPVCTVYIPARTYSPFASTDDPNFWAMVSLAARLWPTYQHWVYYMDEPIGEMENCPNGSNPLYCNDNGTFEMSEDSIKVLDSLQVRAYMTDDPDECEDAGAPTHYVAMIHPDTYTTDATGFTMGGRGRRNGTVLWVKFPDHTPLSSPLFDWPHSGTSLAHELGHNQGRRHVACEVTDGLDPSYPYSITQIGPDTGQYYGFDVRTKTPISNLDAADYMSYCNPKWSSDYTWRAIYESLGDGTQIATVSAAPASIDLTAAASAVFVTGILTPTTHSGALDYAWVYSTTALSAGMLTKWQNQANAIHEQALTGYVASADDTTAANYTLRLLDADGNLLTESALMPSESSDDNSLVRTFVTTLVAPAAAVARMELREDTTLLDSRTPGAATPSVTVVTPAGGEIIQDSLYLAWRSADPDAGDALLYNVQYTPDDGQTWQALLSAFPVHKVGGVVSITLNTSGLPGSAPNQARIRISASDGYHTGMATSAAFTVANRPPQPYISAPLADETAPAGQPLYLAGGANDAEDGGLNGNALAWTVDQKLAGHGPELMVDGLAPGLHPLQLVATDSLSQSGIATSTLTIRPLAIPDGPSANLDGFCDDAAYSGATQLQLAPYADDAGVLGAATVRLVHAGGYLWACFIGMQHGDGSTVAYAGLRVDANDSRDDKAQSDDLAFLVAEDGTPLIYSGDGAGGFAEPGPEEGFTVRVSSMPAAWTAEVRIEEALLGGWGHWVGLSAGHYALDSAGHSFAWPFAALPNSPVTWATTALAPLPVIEVLDPISATAGAPAFLLHVSGADFAPSSIVTWNGTALSTTVGDGALLTATVPAANFTDAGSVEVRVRTPGSVPGSTTFESNAVTFWVLNPTPSITMLSPDTAPSSGAAFTLTVEGSNFVAGATVLWNGSPLPTTYVGANRLAADIDSSSLLLGQVAGVTVLNPAPDAAASNTVPFTVPASTLFLPITER